VPPDEVLVAQLRAGDDAAFALVLDAWSPGMVRVARRCVPTADLAAEVVQDTWLAVVEGLGGFEGRSSLKTWVYRILVNKAQRLGGRESRTVPYSSLTANDEGPTVDPSRFQGPDEPYPGHWREWPAPWPDDPADATLAAELRRCAGAAVAELPERQRVVLALRDIEGYDAAEVCSILDITATNQRVLLHRARAHVRRSLENYFAEVPA
jgi:RNA polymerase sigma-70 factor (ECF subfamily)